MKTLNVLLHCTFFICVCCISLCGTLITSSPRINETDEIIIPAGVEVILNNKTVLIHENVELLCEVKPRSAALAITWKKNNEIIFQSDRIKIAKHKIVINRTRASDGGYYTCSVKTPVGNQSKTAILTVTELDEEDEDDFSGEFPCGRPDEREISECADSYGFSNCKSFAPAVDVNDIKITQTLINSSISYPTKRIDIEWRVPKAGNSDIWGWQVTTAEMNAHAGPSLCVQVNKKYIWESKNGDLYMKYTLLDIPLGTTIELTIQSLPAMDMTKSVVKKTILTKGFCELSQESPCCYEVKNIMVKQMDKTSVMLSWPDLTNSSIISTMLSGFDVTYNSTYPGDLCHHGLFTTSVKAALNTSYIIIQDLRPHCQNYSVKVRPIFTNISCNKCSNSICDPDFKRGKYSKFYFFRMAMNESFDVYHINKHSLKNLFKALLIVVVLLIFSICLFVVIVIRRRKRALEKVNEPATISKGRPVTEIFIAHGSHCRDCEDVVLSVATYLNMTGYCKCFLDLCSLPKEWSPGKTQYYENQIAKRQKVIILFTINDDEESKDNIKARNFIYQKNLIRSELLANCPTTKFIPVYMDFLSDLDIPSFLRNKKSFSLPSQLNQLILYTIGEPVCKPVSVCPMLSVDEDSNLLKQKKILEAKIKDLNAKHQKKLKTKNNNLIAKIV